MENHNLIQFLNTCLSAGCVEPFGFSKYETHVYLAFCIFNVGRLFTYFPTIAKLRAAGCTGDGQSIWTWICWILANISLSYYMYIAGKYQITDLVWINVINTTMCLVCLLYIIKVQKRAGTLKWIPFSKPKKNYLVTVSFADELRQPLADTAERTGMPISVLVSQAVNEFLATEKLKAISNRRANQVSHCFLDHQKITRTIGEY